MLTNVLASIGAVSDGPPLRFRLRALLALLIVALPVVVSCGRDEARELQAQATGRFIWFKDLQQESPEQAQRLVDAQIGESGWLFKAEEADFTETGHFAYPSVANYKVFFAHSQDRSRLALQHQLLVYDRERSEWMPVGEEWFEMKGRDFSLRKRNDIWSGDYGTYDKPLTNSQLLSDEKRLKALADFLGMTIGELKAMIEQAPGKPSR